LIYHGDIVEFIDEPDRAYQWLRNYGTPFIHINEYDEGHNPAATQLHVRFSDYDYGSDRHNRHTLPLRIVKGIIHNGTALGKKKEKSGFAKWLVK
jgi:hypothetical protein